MSFIDECIRKLKQSEAMNSHDEEVLFIKQGIGICIETDKAMNPEEMRHVFSEMTERILNKQLEETGIKETAVDDMKQKDAEKKEEEEIFVSQAGLILLHPFLESFFGELKLLDDDRFKNNKAREEAVHLLNFLATGKENPPEYNLLLEKYICGLDFKYPVKKKYALTCDRKKECETLLRAAIGHWKGLKNTSVDGFRKAFIQRRGKLIFNEFQDRLVVEGESYDVLLSYLPWGYGLIKFPWHEKALAVDWLI